jgi:Lar family restriction alleviation protein
MTQRQEQTMPELLQCPFCGFPLDEGDIQPGEGSWWVDCSGCDCRGPDREAMEEAIEAWNSRRTDGFENWIEGELAKLKDDGHPEYSVRSAHRRAALMDCRKQLRKLLGGMGVQESR